MSKPTVEGPEPRLLADFRIAAGLTQAQAAALVYVTTDAWARWESMGPRARRMPMGLFELFTIKAKLADRHKPRPASGRVDGSTVFLPPRFRTPKPPG